jgi:ParB family chromosome partitioning protein
MGGKIMTNVTNVYDMFGISPEENEKDNSSKEGIKEIELSKLVPFFKHPFKLYEGDRLNDMVDSIKEYGIILPLIVRKKEDTYEILSGHNRANAAGIAGLTKAPVVIKDNLTDEEAMLIVTETNLIQRSFAELTHSEKARVLAERHSAMKQQGKRTDIINEIENLYKADKINENSTSRKVCEKSTSDKIIAESYNLSPRTVSNYLRIDTLIDNLKNRLDNGEIPFMSAVDLSFLKQKEQDIVDDIVETHKFKVNLNKSEVLKIMSKEKKFNYEKAYKVLSGEYFKRSKKVKKFNLKPKIISKYFKENQTQKEIEKIIEDALNLYFTKEASNEETEELEIN